MPTTVKTPRTARELDEAKLQQMVDEAARIKARIDEEKKELDKVEDKLTEQAQLRRQGFKPVTFVGRRAQATVVFGQSVKWDMAQLASLRQEMPQAFDGLFSTEVEYAPKNDATLEEFLASDTPDQAAIRARIEEARTVKEKAPAVRITIRK